MGSAVSYCESIEAGWNELEPAVSDTGQPLLLLTESTVAALHCQHLATDTKYGA